MNKKVLVVWNSFLFVFFILQVISALFMITGVIYDKAYILHIICGGLLTVAVLGHLFLNRSWIKSVFKKK